jgi:hypothetical protein
MVLHTSSTNWTYRVYAASISIVTIVCMLPIPRRHRGGRESRCALTFFVFFAFFCENTLFPDGSAFRGKKCAHQGRITDSRDRAYNFITTGRRPQRWSVVQFSDFGVLVSTFAECDVRSSLLMWEDLADFLHVTPERSFRIEHNRYWVLVRFAWCGLQCHLQIPLRTYNLQKLEDVLTTSKFRICWRRLSVWGEADSETSPIRSVRRSR